MRRPIRTSPTDGVAVRALVDRPTGEGGGRAESVGGVTEQRDRCDVLIRTRRQGRPGHEISRRGTQGIASEHHAGVRAASRHGLNVGAYIVGADGGVQVGGIVDSIHPDRHRHLGAQRIDECIADCADAGWFLSAASENHFGIGALGRCRRNQRRCPKGRRCRGNHQCRGERGGGRQAEDTVRAWCYRNRPHNTIFGSIVACVTSRSELRHSLPGWFRRTQATTLVRNNLRQTERAVDPCSYSL